MKCFLFVLLTAFSYANWHAQDTDQAKIAGVITQLKKNEYSAVAGVKFSDEAKAATELARAAAQLDDSKARERIMNLAMDLEEKCNYSNEGGFRWSSNLSCAEAAIGYLRRDVRFYERSEVAGKLLLLYKPADLGRYVAQIEGAVKASSLSMEGVPSRLLMLYGVLPSTRLSDVIPYVPKEAGPYDHGQFMYDAVLARLGDAEAQKRLMDFAVSLKRTGGAAWEALESALAYADSKEMRLFLARNLRCEEYGEMTGNASFPKRWTYAQALIKMMRDTPTFPLRYGAKYLKLEDDATWDSMEVWCTAHLGVQYPKEPRKHMNII